MDFVKCNKIAKTLSVKSIITIKKYTPLAEVFQFSGQMLTTDFSVILTTIYDFNNMAIFARQLEIW